MLLRRHRATPEIDPGFALTPAETLDPAFTAGEAGPRHTVFDLETAIVDEVLAHAAESPESIEELLANETSGKARKGVLEGLERLRESHSQSDVL